MQYKFRAWDKKLKKMGVVLQMIFGEAYGAQIIYKDNSICFTTTIAKDGHDIVLMQFTGLTDKNGKEIYSGDVLEATGRIVEWTSNEPKSKMPSGRHRVDFKDGAFIMRRGKRSRKYRLSSQSIHWGGFEVIGNIYEHPNLLEK